MGYNPTNFDTNIWIKKREGGYEYVSTHTNDILSLALDPYMLFEKLKYAYIIKKYVAPEVYIGCDYMQVKVVDTNILVMCYSTYTLEAFPKLQALLGFSSLRKENITIHPGDHPELNYSPLLGEAQN